jgi:glycosyltransferase involved in cell wall biosynthesis
MHNKDYSVCILTTSSVHSDPRVLKQIYKYQEMQIYTVIGGYNHYPGIYQFNGEYHLIKEITQIDEAPSLNQRIIRVIKSPQRLVIGILKIAKSIIYKLLLLFGRIAPPIYEFIYWSRRESIRLYEIASCSDCDLFHANDIYTLPAILKAANGKPVIFDAHEYAPHELELTWEGKYLINPYQAYLCWKYIPMVSKMTTVCDSIAHLYFQKTGVMPLVIRNTPPYQLLPARSTNHENIKIIHHGAAAPERRLEDMIEVISLLPTNYTLTFMLVDSGVSNYIDKLKMLADLKAKGRVFFESPVSYNELITVINKFDIGIFLLGTIKNTNYRFALPNKLFEFIMAGLCVAIGPSVEMQLIVEKYKCGIVSSSFSPQALAKSIENITIEQIDQFKKNSLKAAQELNSEIEMQVLEKIYQELTNITV